MKRSSVLLAIFVVVMTSLANSSAVSSQTRRRKAPAPAPRPSTAATDKRLADIQAGRERIANQIKNLTQFLYLLGGISNGIELAEQANRSRRSSPNAIPAEQIARNKARVNESVRNVRAGLDELETSFRSTASLQIYYRLVSGVGDIGRNAESQAAANRFDESARSLIRAASQLTDALVALH